MRGDLVDPDFHFQTTFFKHMLASDYKTPKGIRLGKLLQHVDLILSVTKCCPLHASLLQQLNGSYAFSLMYLFINNISNINST